MRYVKRNVATANQALGFTKDKPFEVETPQYESYTEFETAAGGPDKALEFVNGAVATGSVNAARAVARNTEPPKTRDEALSAAREAAHDYTPSGGERQMGLKRRAEKAKDMLAQVRAGALPSEDALEQLAALFGA